MLTSNKHFIHSFSLCLLLGLLVLVGCRPKKEIVSTPENSKQIVEAQIWTSSPTQLIFPEDELNIRKTGICMSGGGTRAMVCATGQLQALRKIGVLDTVGYLSCVSGGSWASVPFTYYNAGAANDDELLGTIIKPKDLRCKTMKRLAPEFLAGAANCALLDKMICNLGSYAYDDIWIQGVSECYMQKYGLYHPNNPKYFSYKKETVKDIIYRNPGKFSQQDFVTVHNQEGDAKRPYLVVNSSIVGPSKNAPYQNPEHLAVMNYTPLGVGSAKLNTAYYTPEVGAEFNLQVGGGFIEPFAFGGGSPSSAPIRCETNKTCVKVNTPNIPYTIADASGTSSSAFVAEFTSHGIDGHSLTALAPKENYWPVGATIYKPEQEFIFGDGGNLENLGAIALMQRKVKDLVVFVNTSSKLNENFDTLSLKVPGASDISSDILTLFGIPFSGSQDMNQNTVFKTDDIRNLMSQFVKKKSKGKSIIAKTSLTTIANKWWGIPAGETYNITWVYNDTVDEFNDQLHKKIRKEINRGDLGDFPHFPRYNTIDEDFGRIVKLSKKQINLLYQFSAWNVYSNKDQFDFLKKPLRN
jgi:hypothetical protein